MGKKRRAAPSNPNRGFATTSTPSKAKPEPEPEKTESPIPAVAIPEEAVEPENTKATQSPGISNDGVPHQETSFEEMEINALYGQHGTTVQRMTEKYLAKLSLDSQSVKSLPTTTGIMQAETLDSILHRYRQSCEHQTRRKEKVPFATAWALWECLVGIGGMTRKEIGDGLSWWLERGVDKTLEGGVEEVTSWIYAGRQDDSEVVDKSEEAEVWHPPRQQGTNPRRRRRPKRVAFQSPGTQAAESESESENEEEEEEEEEETEEEDDDEDDVDDTEESLIEKYIVLQTKLFKISPDLAPPPRPTQNKKGKKTAQPKQIPSTPAKTTTRSLKLSGKITTIQRDPLFDQHNADLAWREKRIDLVQELPKPLIKDPKPPPPLDTEPGKSILKGADKEEEEDDGGLLGGIFNDPVTTATILNEDGTSSSITIRDFDAEFAPKPDPKSKFKKSSSSSAGAKISMPAVKFLEESIRARLGGISQVRIEDVSTTHSSSRLAVMIFSKNAHAEKYDGQVLEKLGCKIYNLKKGGMRVEMDVVAARTKLQAEWYIVTVTLWVCCRDRAPSSRLATTWRAVWNEICEREEEVKENRKKDVVRTISGVLDKFQPEDEWVDETERKVARQVVVEKEDRERELNQLDGETIRSIWQRKASTDRYRQMLKGRQELPMWQYRDDVMDCIKKNQVTIICGETGCGKSTQVPAFILEEEMSEGKDCRIYCTEPRRISAISLARRVSEELGERKQDVGTKDSLIGYAIRLESKVTKDTRLTYATTGVVMRMLERSPELKEATHLVLDEVHERSIDSDFLLIVLKKLLQKRKELKVVLMSATVDAEKFSRYLGDAPVLNVPGRTFPVQTHFLEDAIEVSGFELEQRDTFQKGGRKGYKDNYLGYDDGEDSYDEQEKQAAANPHLKNYSERTQRTLVRLTESRLPVELIIRFLEAMAHRPDLQPYSKAILVFLPGLAEIRKVDEALQSHHEFGSSSGRWLVYPLHSTIASEDQEAVFNVPPPGKRKIVLATNIAETGITIPDITCVVDTGRHKEMRFDERRQISRLVEVFISRANAKQRRGRAGRVQEGLCWHLFSKQRFETGMIEQQTPEMLRLSLQELALRIKTCKLGGIEEFLNQALDSPSQKNIRKAIDNLVEAKALTANENLTDLGRKLSILPLDIYLGKLVLLGLRNSCVDVMVTIAAILSAKSPFVRPFGEGKEADKAKFSFRRGNSDLLTAYNAYSCWRDICITRRLPEHVYCTKNYLSSRNLSTIEDLRLQLFSTLADLPTLFPLSASDRTSLMQARSHNSHAYSSPRSTFWSPPPQCTQHSSSDAILITTIASSFYPRLLIREPSNAFRSLSSQMRLRIHPSSINIAQSQPTASTDPSFTKSKYLAYTSLLHATGSANQAQNQKPPEALETTCVSEGTMVLGVGDAGVNVVSGEVRLDGNRGKWRFERRVAVGVRWVRGEWEKGLVREGEEVEDVVRAVTEAARKEGV